ncbi:DUF72 domain-containing protein [Arthrobacter sp. UYCu723]
MPNSGTGRDEGAGGQERVAIGPGALHVGTSGWSYDHWEGVLYPPGLPARDRLAHYTDRFSTVELNASFYRWPREASFASWRRRLPEGFLLSVKAPRGLTHGRKLYSPEVWVERIIRCWHELADKRAVLLVQLPPDFARDDARLDYFLTAMPEWIRIAVELRHPSWDHAEVYALLERHRAAYCVMSGAGLPCILRATAPFVYVRLHGPDQEHLYGGSYSDDDLRWWADRVSEWRAAGKDVFMYFNNDGAGNAVRNAATLRVMLGDA